MATAPMDISVTLRLVDKMTAPAKQMEKTFRSMMKAAEVLGKVGGFANLAKQMSSATTQMQKLESNIKTIESALRQVVYQTNSFGRSVESAAAKSPWATQIREMRQYATLQRQLIANQGRAAAAASHGGGGIGLFGLAYGAHEIGHGIMDALHKAGSYQQETAALEMLNLSPDVQKRAIEAATAASKAVPSTTAAENLHRFRELNYAFADPDKAISSLIDVDKALAAMSRIAGPEGANQILGQAMDIVKSGELGNSIKTSQDFKLWLDSLTRMTIASGGNVQPQSMSAAFKYARSALAPYNDEFKSLFMPEFVQEFATGKGSGARGGAGPALAAFKRMFVDSTVAKQNIPALVKGGLVDPNMIKGGKLLPGAFYGSKLAAENPFRFMEQYIVPALKRAGINLDDHAAVSQEIAKWGGTDLAKQLVQLATIQREQMEKRAGMTSNSMNTEGAYNVVEKTYEQKLQELQKQSSEFERTLASPWIESVTSVFKSLTETIKKLNEWASQHAGLVKLLTAGVGLLGLSALPTILKHGGGLIGGGLGFMMGGLPGMLFGGAAARGAGSLLGGIAGGSLMLGGGIFAGLMALANLSRDDRVTRGLEQLVQSVSDSITKLGDSIMSAFQSIPERLHALVDQISQSFKADGFVGVGKTIMDGLLSGLQSAAETVIGWATGFIGKLKELFSFQASPSITPKVPGGSAAPPDSSTPVPGIGLRPGQLMRYQGPSPARSSGHVIQANIHVHGVSDPVRVAALVHKRFQEAIENHLSDGVYAT